MDVKSCRRKWLPWLAPYALNKAWSIILKRFRSHACNRLKIIHLASPKGMGACKRNIGDANGFAQWESHTETLWWSPLKNKWHFLNFDKLSLQSIPPRMLRQGSDADQYNQNPRTSCQFPYYFPFILFLVLSQRIPFKAFICSMQLDLFLFKQHDNQRSVTAFSVDTLKFNIELLIHFRGSPLQFPQRDPPKLHHCDMCGRKACDTHHVKFWYILSSLHTTTVLVLPTSGNPNFWKR